MTRAALYLRQSKDRTGEELAVERQRDDALRLAELRGWEVVQTEVDNDISAAGKRTRPAFERVLAGIESGEVQAVIAWDMTRLTRNRRDTVRVIETGQQYETKLAFVKGSDLDLSTSSGRMVADILASVAREEIEQKSERQMGQALQAAQLGQPHVGGPRAFGYERDGVTVREDEAEALRAAYAALLAGDSLVSITKVLAERFTTPAGKPFHRSAARAILLNCRNAGVRSYTSKVKGKLVTREIGPALWPAIVDLETFRAAAALLSDPSRRKNRGTARRWLGGGLFLCGAEGCGSDVKVAYRGDKDSAGNAVRAYRCRRSTHLSRSADWCDNAVSEAMIARLSRTDAAELLVDQTRSDIGELHTQSSKLRLRLAQLAADYGRGDIEHSEWCAGREPIKAELAALEERMAHVGRGPVLAELVNAEDVRAKWHSIGLDRQRAVINLLADVTLLRRPPGRFKTSTDTIRIDWKTG